MAFYPPDSVVSSQPYPDGWSARIRQLLLCVDSQADESTLRRAIGLMYGLFLESKLRDGHAAPPTDLARQALTLARGDDK